MAKNLLLPVALADTANTGKNTAAGADSTPAAAKAYYAMPEIGKDTDALYNAAKAAEQAVRDSQSRYKESAALLQEKEEAMALWTGMMQMARQRFEATGSASDAAQLEKYRQSSLSLMKQFGEAKQVFDAAEADYGASVKNYDIAATDYNRYVGEQKKLYDDWKSTVRSDTSAVQAELDAVNKQLAQLQGKDTLGKVAHILGQAGTAAMGGTPVYTSYAADPQLDALTRAKALLEEELYYSRGFGYDALRENSDFAEKSQYKSTANGKAEKNYLTGGWKNTGYDDINYDYINRVEDAVLKGWSNDNAGNLTWTGYDRSHLQQMSDEEIKMFNYLYASQGSEAAYAYVDYLMTSLTQRQRTEKEAEMAQYAKENPVGASLGSILLSPLKVMSYAGQIADYAQDGEIDQNAGYNKYSYTNTAIRDAVSKKVEENWGGVGSFAYQTGMSMADFLLNTAISGGNGALSMTVMGSGAAADTTIAAKDRGLNDNQAFALGTIAGLAEAVTERFSLEALLKPGMSKTALGYILKNALTEASEEGASTLINTMADIIISKDKSEWAQSIQAYKKAGKSEGEAFGLALADQAMALGLDMLGGAISGGFMGTGGAVINHGSAVQTGKVIGKANPDMAQIQDLIMEGLSNDPSTRSNYLAQQYMQKLQRGEKLSDTDLGKLYQANQQVDDRHRGTNAEAAQKMLDEAAQKMAESQTVGNAEALNTNAVSQPLESYPAEKQTMIRSYLNAVDEKIKAFVQSVKSGDLTFKRQKISDVSARAAADIKGLLGVDVQGYTHNINTHGLQHILNRHGANGKQNQTMAMDEDIARVGWVLDNYDSVELLTENGKQVYSTEFLDKSHSPAPQIRFTKKIDGTYYVVEAAFENDYKKLWVQSAYLQKNEDVTQTPAEGVATNRETNALSEFASPSSQPIIDQGGGVVNTNQQNGGNENAGAGVSDGVGQRQNGMGTREPAGGLAGRSGSAEGRNAQRKSQQTAIGRQNRAKDLVRQGLIQQISSKELGLKSGTDTKNVAVLPQEHWDEELRDIAQRVQEETGKEVTFVVGKMQIQNGKFTQEVRGVRTRDSIIVQVDNLKVSARQIADHEIFHDLIHRLPLEFTKVERQVVESCSREELEAVVGRYWDDLAPTMAINDNTDLDKLYWKIEEEVMADAYAGIDYKGFGATKFTEPVQQYVREQTRHRGQRQANGVRQTNGPNLAQENTALEDGEWYSLNESFETELQEWFDSTTHEERKISGRRFLVGTTSDVLKSIGVRDYNIYFGGAKIDKILTDNASMSLDTIKEAVRLLEDPILIMDSLTVEDSIVLFGEVYTNQQKPVMISVLLNPKTKSGEVLDYAVITSAYGRREGNLQNLINRSRIFYVNEQKNRTDKWLKALGLQLPSAITKYGSIDSISVFEDSVNDKFGELQENNGELYSMDEGEVSQIDAELDAQMKRWKEQFLQNRLGEEGAKEYHTQKAQQEAQRKAEQKLKDKEKRKEDSNRRKLQKEYRDSKADAAMNKKLREGAKPTQAKKELRASLLDMFSIPAGNRAEIAELIDSMADRMIREGALTENLRKSFFDRMYASGVMTVPADEYMEIGRDAVNKGKVYVDEHLRAELGDDWSELRRRAFGAGVYLTNDRADAGLDQWNHELAEMLPGLFDSEETDMRSILERILYVAEQGKAEKVNLPEYTAQLAGEHHVSEDEILDSMERSMDTALRIFAKTAGMEIQLKEQSIRSQAALTKENMRLRWQMAQERQERKDMARQAQEQKDLREMQQRTLKALQWLNKNRWRAPEELKATFDEVLSDIDVYAVGAANEMRWSDKYGATWKDLAQMYQVARDTDPNFMPSKELEMIVSRLNDQKIADMDMDALNTLYKAAVGLRTEFYNRNNVVNDQLHRMFEEVYGDSKAELKAAAGGYTGKMLDRLFNMEQLTAMNVLHRMAGWNPDSAWYSMAQQLERGERDVRAFTVKANRMLEEFLTEHADWVKKADGQGKDAVWYTLEVPELLELGHGDKPIFGDTVTVHMTPAQKIHMYLESKNVDNLRHMMGGRTFADRALYSEGKRKEAFAQGKTIRLAPETVKQIVSDLTAEEMELAQILEKFYNEFAKGEINRVSNILYGYDKAMGKNYAPIFTNQNYVQSEVGIFDQTAEGVGNMKGRIPYSKNPSYNIGAFDAFERNVDQTARFVGMSIPARNWNTLLNWRESNDSMGDVVTHQWGEESKKYIENLLVDLQGGKAEKKDVVSESTEKLMSNYISSVFGANPSIVLKQLGSIPLAGVYLGGGNVPTPMQVAHIDRALIRKYTQDLDWRSMGYSMPETKQLKDNPNWTQTNKAVKFTFGGGAITAMDTWAASTLWPWAENKVRKEHPELELGTREQIDAGQSPFYKKVAEEFENALARSQSTSDQMHQSTLRKSKSTIARMFTMFRSDSAQTYNAMRQMIGEAQYIKANGGDKAEVQKATRAVGTVFLAALSNFMLAEGINLAMAMIKNKGKAYRDDEEELTVESILSQVGVNLLKGFSGIFAGGEELADAIGAVLLNEKWYEVESMEVSLIQDLMSLGYGALEGVRDLIAEGVNVAINGGDLLEYFRRHGNDMLGAIKDAAMDVAGFLGVPAANVEAYLIGLVKKIPGFDAAYEDVFATATKSGLSGLSGKDLQVRIGNILDIRGVEAADDTQKALADLYAEGYTNAIPSNTPGTVTVDGEEHKLNAYQKQVYDKAWGAIVDAELDAVVGSKAFRDADPEKQEKMLKTLYGYAADEAKAELFAELGGSSRADDIAAFEEAGLDMADYLGTVADGHRPEKFLEAVTNGLSAEQADNLMDEIAELEPEDGAEQVADVQKWRLCVDMFNNPASQLAALATHMSDSQIKKAMTANNMDVSLDAFVKLYEIRDEYNADGNKSFSQAEYKAAIDSMRLSRTESAVLWQLATGAKSAKNNPYSTSVGQKVLDALE